ncbi:acyltransferase family protein [Mycobacterium montefiorense]|uniref:Acyltransferase n=1 Tax=Mycobacterium montefiorense TaxID=154654 RepID=A0AA37UT53_9MYCO|nr:acyltransferase [Mycobacterium montefiorense]GBG36907.1 acyltransferase [Mycobacterium montefiorense]GKU37813.1 acyltransferase [Mycobacterium montefiorense]GKU42772.1 acyltransferase [Mycobacterium montefiorense]GKU46351.1 acyltransferase [Mycobacterium montefiorense]GKU51065.1 acyltransferase [Mycobacterium montefiorense]
MKLAEVFNPRCNALNLFRLGLASEVMLFHSWPITGHMPPHALLQLMFAVGVDGFFAISGFLITASWLRDPRVRDYLTARALRILPGLYVCLIITAFVFAPLSVAVQGGSPAKLLLSTAPFEYVLKNATLVSVLQFDVAGTPLQVASPGVWNASLWSLIWEVLCYFMVAVIGILGLANHRWVTPAILALAVVAAMFLPPLTFPGSWTIPQLAVRSAIMFSAGALMYQWKDVIPARWSLVAASVVVVVAASVLLPDYRVVAALPLAYTVIVSGSLIRNTRTTLRTDLSYGVYIYAFPTQQLLVVLGLGGLHPAVFFVVALCTTLPLAAMSWFSIEKPSMALKSRLKQKWSARARPQADAPSVADPTAGQSTPGSHGTR